jgi:hypothetical protein
MKTESLIWLLPVVFMIHELEEIIFLKPWLNKHINLLPQRLPKAASVMLTQTNNLSVHAFVLIVAEEFLLISGLVLLAFENSWFILISSLVLAICLHNLIHLLQLFVIRKCLPVLFSSIVVLGYGYLILGRLLPKMVSYRQVLIMSVGIMVAFLLNYLLMHKLAQAFDRTFFLK